MIGQPQALQRLGVLGRATGTRNAAGGDIVSQYVRDVGDKGGRRSHDCVS